MEPSVVYNIFVWIVIIIVLVAINKFLDRGSKKQKKAERSKDTISSNSVDFSASEVNDYITGIAEKREKDSAEYRRIYGLSDDLKLYHDYYISLGIISSTNMNVTRHEAEIASLIIQNHFFDRRCVFLDSYFKAKNGRYVQADVIAVNRKGVFVIESKDYNGWIYGNGNQQQWTSIYYKDRTKFYNPIRQNYGHVQCLKDFLKKQGVNYYSIIIFGDDAELKNVSYVPKNAFVATTRRMKEMMSDIMQKEDDCLSAGEILEICRLINQNKIEPTEEIRNDHINTIKDRTGEDRVYD